MKAIIGINTEGNTLLYTGEDEKQIKTVKQVASKADIAVQEIDLTEEEVLETIKDNTVISKLQSINNQETAIRE